MSLRDAMNKVRSDPDEDIDADILGVEQPDHAEQPATAVQAANSDAVPNENAQVQPDYGPAMAACTERERTFVLYRFQPDISDAKAARLAGYGQEGSNANTYARIAYRLTHENPRVIAAIQEVAKNAVRALSTDAVKALKQIVNEPFNPQRAKVALALVERVEPTVQRQDVNVTHEIVDHRQEALVQLKTLKALGVPREKLEQLFGYSGLPMLERQLAQQEAAAQPAIDAEYTEIKPEE